MYPSNQPLKYLQQSIARHFFTTGIGRQNLIFSSSCLASVLLGSIALSPSAKAIDIPITGLVSTSGVACKQDTVYRFSTSSVYNGKQLDLLVKVLAEDNEDPTCVSFQNGTLSVYLRDTDAGSDTTAYMDLRLTVVEKNTNTPVEVDRLSVTGFDLDSFLGASATRNSPAIPATGTDDIYLKSPDGAYISSGSNVAFSSGSFSGGYTVKLKGQTSGNCTDSLAATDIACRGGAIFTKGINGNNQVSTFDIRVQNDDAYSGVSTSDPSYNRLFLLSLELQYLTTLLGSTSDFGDAPNSYGGAAHKIDPNITLGIGTPADNDLTNQGGTNANGDDTDTGNGKYDDEDAVSVNGATLSGQTLTANAMANLDVTTFGAGKLSAWIDYNRDGDFNDPLEKVINEQAIANTSVKTTTIAINIPPNIKNGTSYARFRYTTAAGIEPSGVSTESGETEDYQVNLASGTAANMILVKRITAINGVSIASYQDDTTSARKDEDNSTYWPAPLAAGTNISSFLKGSIDGIKIKPGDTIEYTIYFLNIGGNDAKKVRICDRSIGRQTLTGNTITLGKGDGTSGFTTTNTLTTNADGDRGTFYTAAQVSANPTLTAGCNLPTVPSGEVDNGAIVVDVDGTNAPIWNKVSGSITASIPNSYGFVRFTTKVDP